MLGFLLTQSMRPQKADHGHFMEELHPNHMMPAVKKHQTNANHDQPRCES